MKRIIVSIISFAIMTIGFAALPSYLANAGPTGGGAQNTKPCDQANATFISNFFSFPTWDRGLKCNTDGGIVIQEGADIATNVVFPIALNIIDIALRLVAIIAVGFVIYGGFRYVTSRGEPEMTKNALDTILKALIGAVIAMIAAIAVSFLVGGLSRPLRSKGSCQHLSAADFTLAA